MENMLRYIWNIWNKYGNRKASNLGLELDLSAKCRCIGHVHSEATWHQKQLSWLDSLTVEIQLNIGQQSQLPWLRPSYVYMCDMTHPQSPIPSYILCMWIVHHFLGCAAKQSTCWGASWCHPVHSCTCATLLSEVMDFHNTLVILVLVGVSGFPHVLLVWKCLEEKLSLGRGWQKRP